VDPSGHFWILAALAVVVVAALAYDEWIEHNKPASGPNPAIGFAGDVAQEQIFERGEMPNAGIVLGIGQTLLQGGLILGSGIHSFGGWKMAIQDYMNESGDWEPSIDFYWDKYPGGG